MKDSTNLVEASILSESIKTGGIGATVGLFAATLQGLWVRATPKSVLNHTLTRAAQFGAFGALFQGSSIAVAKVREKNDSFNFAFGGGVVGLTAGFLRTFH
jgi:hypothetical protein